MSKHKQVEEAPAQEVAVTASGAVTANKMSIDDLAADAGGGLQNVTATDLATPLIVILQSNSPQVKRSDGKYISGAVEGMLLNTLTNTAIDGNAGITVIPCYFEKCFIEWKPGRGGFVASHTADTPLKNQLTMVANAEGKKVPTLPNGNVLVETNHHYCLVLRDDGGFDPVVIPMASSQLKASRVWNSLMSKIKLQKSDGTLFTPASYYNTYKLTSKARTKDQYSWYVWSTEPAGPTPSLALYNAGKAFEKAVSSGKVKVQVDETSHPENQPAAEAADPGDDGIPF